MRNPLRDFERRLLPLRDGRGFRSRGGSSSSSSDLRLADDFLGLSSSIETRSCGDRRNSLSAAASPNSGSLRPLLFFRPHAIRQRPYRSPPHASVGSLRAGYRKVNAGLGGAAGHDKGERKAQR